MYDTFRVGAVMSRGFGVFFRNFFSFMFLAVIVYSPLLVPSIIMLSGELTTDSVVTFALMFGLGGTVMSIIASAAVTYGTFEQLRGRHASIGASIGVGIKRLLPVIGVAFVVGLGIVGGLILLIVPGVILMCAWWVAIPVAVVEKPGVLASLRRSSELTKGSRWQIFGLVILLALLSNVPTNILEKVLLTENATTGDVRIYLIGLMVISVVTGAIGAVIGAVAYHDLRQVKEGVDTDELASVFE